MAKIVGPSEFRRVLFRSELNGQDFCLGRWPTFDLESDATPPCPVTQKRKSIPSRKSWRRSSVRRSSDVCSSDLNLMVKTSALGDGQHSISKVTQRHRVRSLRKESQFLPVNHGELLQFDEVHATFAELTLRHE